jgi:hypothetical protein
MQNLTTLITNQSNQFKGNIKDLKKLINKIESTSHAPTSQKHTKRMESFAQIPEIVKFINDTLKIYFENNNNFEKDKSVFSSFDIKESWYLFTLLVCSSNVETTVNWMIDSMIESKNEHLYIVRRILNLCDNTIYKKQLKKVEDYFILMTNEVEVYAWAKKIGFELPQTYNWEFYFTLYGKLKENCCTSEGVSEPIIIEIRANSPKGNGESYYIRILDRDSRLQGTWDDFNTDLKIRAQGHLYELKTKPSLMNLKQFFVELEELFKFSIDRKISSSYFARGIKKRTNIQKWLLKD